MDNLVEIILQLGDVVDALVELGLKIGTLIAIIKMIIDSLK